MSGDVVETACGLFSMSVATTDEAPALLRLRDELAAWMVHQGVDQWHPGEMPLAWLDQCIAHGWVHTAWAQQQLVASVTITWEDPFIWEKREAPAGYIHMLMVDRAYAGNGVGRSILGWSERKIAASGRSLARLDCATTNRRLRVYYEQAGYQHVGQRTFGLAESKIFPDVDRLVDTALYEKALAR